MAWSSAQVRSPGGRVGPANALPRPIRALVKKPVPRTPRTVANVPSPVKAEAGLRWPAGLTPGAPSRSFYGAGSRCTSTKPSRATQASGCTCLAFPGTGV